jgi:hypothetical protein
MLPPERFRRSAGPDQMGQAPQLPSIGLAGVRSSNSSIRSSWGGVFSRGAGSAASGAPRRPCQIPVATLNNTRTAFILCSRRLRTRSRHPDCSKSMWTGVWTGGHEKCGQRPIGLQKITERRRCPAPGDQDAESPADTAGPLEIRITRGKRARGVPGGYPGPVSGLGSSQEHHVQETLVKRHEAPSPLPPGHCKRGGNEI